MNIPFHPNTGDGTHCFQAVLKMTLGAFEPDTEYSYDQLDQISQKVEGKWTWPTAAMVWLMERGYEVKLIEEFDYKQFAERGMDYLIAKCGQEVAEAQADNSLIEEERKTAAAFVERAPVDYRVPSLDDLKQLVSDGWVVICNINAALLQHQPGYTGHFVVITEVNDKEVVLHDPGLPPCPGFAAEHASFEKAWGYPAATDKNVLAIRKKS